jgi:hypothetical protein
MGKLCSSSSSSNNNNNNNNNNKSFCSLSPTHRILIPNESVLVDYYLYSKYYTSFLQVILPSGMENKNHESALASPADGPYMDVDWMILIKLLWISVFAQSGSHMFIV